MKTFQTVILVLLASFTFAAQTHAVLYWGRPYDPNLQRWIQRDPVGEQGGINLYQFVYNNPLSWFDRDGLLPDGFTPPKGLPPDRALPSFGDMGKAGALMWNSPNTLLGLVLGLLGTPFGGSTPTVGNNALQF